jgi:hypothetical protein
MYEDSTRVLLSCHVCQGLGVERLSEDRIIVSCMTLGFEFLLSELFEAIGWHQIGYFPTAILYV